MYLSFRNTPVKGEYGRSESIDIIYFNCGIKMLLDRYHLVEARNKIEVVVKMKAENTIQAWTDFEQIGRASCRERV